MTQDEIIEMAAESGWVWSCLSKDQKDCILYFSKLVSDKEREQIIAITETQEFSRMYGEFTPSAYDLVKAIRARGEA